MAASHDFNPTDNPCALCGHGEPSKQPSRGVCDVCLQLLGKCSHVSLVLDQPAISQQRIALWPVVSENLAYAGWRNVDGTTGVLVVQFKGPTGSTFRYSNVTRQWWQAFHAAPSKGSFFHSTVRADKVAHPFTKIN